MVYLVAGICIVNIVLWIVFFVKFNKRFSTQKVVEQTRAEVNEILKDMQRTTANNIDLINSTIDQLRQINAEADQKITIIKKKLELLTSDIAAKNGAEKIHNVVQSKIASNRSMGAEYGSQNQKNYGKPLGGTRPNAVYPPINSNMAYQVNKSAQRDLFDEEPLEMNNDVVVMPDGAAYREVPVITTKILDEKTLAQPKKKSINESVMELYNMGYAVEEIATELSISLTEVQFIIDLG